MTKYLVVLCLLLCVFSMYGFEDDQDGDLYGIPMDPLGPESHYEDDNISVWYQSISRSGGFELPNGEIVKPEKYNFSYTAIIIWIKNKSDLPFRITNKTFQVSYWLGEEFSYYVSYAPDMERKLYPAIQSQDILEGRIIPARSFDLGWLLFETPQTARFKVKFEYGSIKDVDVLTIL